MISDAVGGGSLRLEVSIVDLAHEAATAYCAAIVNRDFVAELLERLAVPVAFRDTEHVEALVDRCRRVIETQMAGRFTVAELTALARFYGTPEGRSVARKTLAFTVTVTPMLEAEFIAWRNSNR